MAMQSRTHRSLLLGFIVSISLCGLVGVYCFVFGSWGRLDEQIMLSTLVAALVFLLGFGSAVVLDRGVWPVLGVVGLICDVPTLGISLLYIWSLGLPKTWEQVLGVCWTFAVALPLMGLLSLARLRSQYRWALLGTLACLLLLALIIIATILVPPRGELAELWGRTMGVFCILSACGVIAVPILHHVSAIRVREAVRTVELLLSLTCPRCEVTQHRPAGRSTCKTCGLKFTIEIEEENCRQCGYPLYKIESAVCPECGAAFGLSAGQVVEGSAAAGSDSRTPALAERHDGGRSS